MTTEEFLALPDRKRNVLVAEHVMGWKKPEYEFDGINHEIHLPTGLVLDYTTDIAAAWEVVEKDETLFKLQYDHISDMWDARFGKSQHQAETAPLAICLAALEKVGFLHG